MFTGIVAGLGRVNKVDDAGDRRLWVASVLLADCELGASVAVNGVCLTVASVDAEGCRFDVSPETASRTTLSRVGEGQTVNLERPLRVGSELGGHIVQGHVDGVGLVQSVSPDGDGRRLRIRVPDELDPFIVEKGSVTVDGVSLTVTGVDSAGFEIALVPHTLGVTTLGSVEKGQSVNVEVDVLARFVEKLMRRSGGNPLGGAPEHVEIEEDHRDAIDQR